MYRPINVALVDKTPKIASQAAMVAEKYLKEIVDVKFHKFPSEEDEVVNSCDLMIVLAQDMEPQDFTAWIKRFEQKRSAAKDIWLPVIFAVNSSEQSYACLLKTIFESNWYFDIVSTDQLSSIAVRAANLLRMHDHLKELDRYQTEISELQLRVGDLEKTLTAYMGSKH